VTLSVAQGKQNRTSENAIVNIKVRLHIRFLHAFSALHFNFLLFTLIDQNQGKLCGKRMQKPDV